MRKFLCTFIRCLFILGIGLLVMTEIGHARGNIIIVAAKFEPDGYTSCNLETVSPSYIPPVQENSRLLVPLRAIADYLEFKMDYSNSSIVINKGDTRIELQIGKKTAIKNNCSINLDVAPQVLNGAALVPLRFICEALGWNVCYLTKGFDGMPTVWITPDSLITTKDYSNLNTDYQEIGTIDYGWKDSEYQLKPGRKTVRGIMIGNTITEVKKAYGIPFQEKLDSQQTGTIIYSGPFVPESEISSYITFYVKNGKVREVRLF